MRRVRIHRPSPAMLVALLALFIALGTGAYAAIKLPANSVGTKQLRNGAVTAQKVRQHSLLASNFNTGQLPQGQNGDKGRKVTRVTKATREPRATPARPERPARARRSKAPGRAGT